MGNEPTSFNPDVLLLYYQQHRLEYLLFCCLRSELL